MELLATNVDPLSLYFIDLAVLFQSLKFRSVGLGMFQKGIKDLHLLE